tara:strand:- start:40 stop:249 length:210 start_codon:yes stop_codon:yes gene_type:complete
MAPWKNLNFKGKILSISCILNVIASVILAVEGLWLALFSIVMAAWCGMWTYHSQYQHQDAKDINDGRKE